MTIDQDLLAFANSRLPWQRDSLRRICTQTDLAPADVQEILINLKAVEGLATAGNLAHLAAKHLSSRSATPRAATILTSISEVKHANRLAPNQTLLFAESGITLIYGYNGSGKTGYGRVLRHVCRLRHEKQEPILGRCLLDGSRKRACVRRSSDTSQGCSALDYVDGSGNAGACGPWPNFRIRRNDRTSLRRSTEQNRIPTPWARCASQTRQALRRALHPH